MSLESITDRGDDWILHQRRCGFSSALTGTRTACQLPVEPGESLNVRTESPSISAANYAGCPSCLSWIQERGRFFVAASLLTTFSIGYKPVVQSLSLELYALRGGQTLEVGWLFVTMNVIQTLRNQILDPSLFVVMYMKTVTRRSPNLLSNGTHHANDGD